LLIAACGVLFLPVFSDGGVANAQTASPPAAALRQVSATGLKSFPESAVVALSELTVGAQVGRADLQAAADRVVRQTCATVGQHIIDIPPGMTTAERVAWIAARVTKLGITAAPR